jgi:hypothetical protein
MRFQLLGLRFFRPWPDTPCQPTARHTLSIHGQTHPINPWPDTPHQSMARHTLSIHGQTHPVNPWPDTPCQSMARHTPSVRGQTHPVNPWPDTPCQSMARHTPSDRGQLMFSFSQRSKDASVVQLITLRDPWDCSLSCRNCFKISLGTSHRISALSRRPRSVDAV